ncbi:hypothetical protein AA0312_2706 [Acetobacter tropicalis NRIC 0312]|uniref:Uncharacterized protein n=1 Tax=Acetobacter tropicalis TaxID=104102 RepID=A0A511FNC1_9PROT|nr:hypothetical protein ATR1_039d0019 [Acetobacter tropicalis]GBR72109.1 hypothetical protein AA0312_2706 [Acetobacter tropicalis NRIC 0312]GEL50453.1 hypothetical protein ATR01nite_15280 [Acetobacter tropicalis]
MFMNNPVRRLLGRQVIAPPPPGQGMQRLHGRLMRVWPWWGKIRLAHGITRRTGCTMGEIAQPGTAMLWR